MERLTGVPELLDGPLDDSRSLVANLRDLARINRLTGGTGLSIRAVEALAEPATILDVGTGGADIPMALLVRARSAGRALAVTAADSRPEVLDAARVARPAIVHASGLELVVADGRALPYPDATFDIAHASLVLHHLERDEAVAFVRELARIARLGIVVNDLIRGRLAWVGGWLLVHSIATSRFTRHDGPLSVRRAWSRPELLEIIAAAGLAPVATIVGVAGHRVAIAARSAR